MLQLTFNPGLTLTSFRTTRSRAFRTVAQVSTQVVSHSTFLHPRRKHGFLPKWYKQFPDKRIEMALKSQGKSDNVDFNVDVKDKCQKRWMAHNMRTKS